MRVYEVDHDSDNFQHFFYDDLGYDVALLTFNGDEKGDQFRLPKNIYIPNPMKKEGDFREMGAIVLRESARRVLAPILDPISQYIEFDYVGERQTLLNILNCCDCLDQKRSDIYWKTVPNGHRLPFSIRRYAFSPENFSGFSVFRLPEIAAVGRIFTYEGVLEDKNKEFKYVVEKNNLKGLKFKLVWDSEAEG